MSLQGGKGGLLDALAADELYQKLLRLKQKYLQAEQELGPQSPSLQVRGELPFAFNNVEGHELEDKSKDSKLKQRRSVRMRSRSDSACMFINGAQLQALMRKLISQIGSCHVDTILEYLRRHWDQVRGGDMIPYNTGECRKHVMKRLRSDTTMFARDAENEGCWTLSRDEETESAEIKYYEPQIDCIMRAMEESESGQYTMDYISAYVIKNWARRHPLSDTEIKDSVKLALMTNPRFHYDTTVPGGLVYLRAKKQNQAWAAGTKKQRSMSEEDEEKPPLAGRTESDDLCPPARPSRTASAPMAPPTATASTPMAPPPLPSSPTATASSNSSPSGGSGIAPAATATAAAAVAAAAVTTTAATVSVASTFIFNAALGVGTEAAQSAAAASSETAQPAEPNHAAKRLKRNRMITPPAGYACACGATTPGKGAACKWRKGPNGEFLCNSCGLQSAKKAKGDRRRKEDGVRKLQAGGGAGLSPERSSSNGGGKSKGGERKVKRERRERNEEEEAMDEEQDEDEDGEEDDDDEEDSSPWICCDNCGQWLLAKDDSIDDVSIYDDSNPNHLDYFCPQCRESTATEPGLAEFKDEEQDEDEAEEEEDEEEEEEAEDVEDDEDVVVAPGASRSAGAPNGGGEEERWSFGEDNEGEESGMTSSETTPHLGTSSASHNGSRKRGRTASLYSGVDAVRRKVRPRTRSQQNPISADIMGETVSLGGESKLDEAEHKIRLEWERTVSHQEGEEVDPEVSELEERFWNDIKKYKALITQTRDSVWSKNLVDYKKKKERLKREREKLDAKAESDLMRQFMEYFRKKKRKLVDEREALVSQRTHNPSS